MTSKSAGLSVLFAGIAVAGTGCSAAPGDVAQGEEISATSQALASNLSHLDKSTFDALMHGGAYVSSSSSSFVSGAGCTNISDCVPDQNDPTACWKWVGNCADNARATDLCNGNSYVDAPPSRIYNSVVRCLASGNTFYYDPNCPSHGCSKPTGT